MSAVSPILRSVQGDRLTWWCPGCGSAHVIRCGAGGWSWNGDVRNPTFHPSVLVTYNGTDAGQEQADGRRAPPAVCHSFVVDGKMQFLNDCTHALAGQTVPIPAWPRGG